MTCSTSGTGTLTLGSAVAGFQAVPSALDGKTIPYSIWEVDGSGNPDGDWEEGEGVYTHSGTTLTRATINGSSNGGSAVNFDGTEHVAIVMPSTMLDRIVAPTDTVANLTALHAGRIGFPNNGFSLLRDTGSAMVPWGPIFPFTEPVSGDFSWVNQGTATVSTTNGGVYLEDATSASSQYQHRLRTKTAPATPYTITAAFTMNAKWFDSASQAARAGLAFRQSSDDKLHLFEVVIGTATTGATPQWFFASSKWNSHNNNFSAYYDYAYSYPTGCVYWMRITDDGTNRKCSCSSDGQNWMLLHSVGRTDFLTANQVGFYVTPYDLGVGMTLLSWKET